MFYRVLNTPLKCFSELWSSCWSKIAISMEFFRNPHVIIRIQADHCCTKQVRIQCFFCVHLPVFGLKIFVISLNTGHVGLKKAPNSDIFQTVHDFTSNSHSFLFEKTTTCCSFSPISLQKQSPVVFCENRFP